MNHIAPIDLSAIIKLQFPESQYYKLVTPKRQIVLHHTASGRGVDGDFTHWLTDPARIATSVIIGTDGKIYSLFDSKYWGHHLGIPEKQFLESKVKNSNLSLNQQSIGIELDNWGPLVFYQQQYRSYTGARVTVDQVEEYFPAFKRIPNSPFFDSLGLPERGAFFYQKYTQEQLVSLSQLLNMWTTAYEIPRTYNPDMWNVSKRALSGEPGIWTHVSYRKDKADCHPQTGLIEMLKQLSE
ncbi:MAG: N-acetylmuramoyl-L-alanine amidase [Chryseolinea sp.]